MSLPCLLYCFFCWSTLVLLVQLASYWSSAIFLPLFSCKYGNSLIICLAYSPAQPLSFFDTDVHPSSTLDLIITSERTDGSKNREKCFFHSTGSLAYPRFQNAILLSNIAPFSAIELRPSRMIRLVVVAEQQPHPWNFFTRNVQPSSGKMTPYQSFLWKVDIWALYCVFSPFRVLALLFFSLFFGIGWPVAAVLPSEKRKRTIRQWILSYLASAVVLSWSGYIKFHSK